MSEGNEAYTSPCCASCGMAESDDIKVKKCTACQLVRYCGVECQREHRPQHKRDCEKRAAELRDEILFKQPESSHLGDCPICMIPLSLDLNKSTMASCCSKMICLGCAHADIIRVVQESLDPTCPFCRKPVPTEEEVLENIMKRIEANDPVAMCQQGGICQKKEDYSGAIEYFTKAARLGDVAAHYHLSVLYGKGEVVEKNEKKKIYHLEEAAIGGHPSGRYDLGLTEEGNGKFDRATKHYIIAAGQGHDRSMKRLVENYKRGLVKKEDLEAALRVHHAAVDETKNPQREAAEEYYPNQDEFFLLPEHSCSSIEHT